MRLKNETPPPHPLRDRNGIVLDMEAWAPGGESVKEFKRYVYYSPDIDELCVVMKVPFKEKEIPDLYTVSYGFDNFASHHKNYLKRFLVKIGEL